jgi:uncharacterized protein YndB with AHSA1/START domain
MNDTPAAASPAAPFTLRIKRTLDAPLDAVWRCWSEPDLLMRWYCPLPWRVTRAQMDMRPGGVFSVVMEGPNGERQDAPGVWLAIEPRRRLVFTDAFTEGFKPRPEPFMTGEVLFEPTPDGRTHYVAMAHHWRAEDMETHRAMGFDAGWNAAADQLEALAKGLHKIELGGVDRSSIP